jgi:hypothetical protein
MEFNSQICTTEEQSKRLLALGLKMETADMVLLKELAYDDKRHCLYDADTYMIRPIDYLNGEDHRGNIPAWSLHRLIEMCNKTQFGMTIGIYNDEVTVDGDLFEVYDNTYDNLISIIEWLIGLGKFNENYLDIH